jgi:hypothetical protein
MLSSGMAAMDAICFSETSVDFQQATWRYLLPLPSALLNYHCEKLNSYEIKFYLINFHTLRKRKHVRYSIGTLIARTNLLVTSTSLKYKFCTVVFSREE